jgi:glyoxylase-like metal-dependent hydrolase (beta-lactamase superfamily II)
MKKIEPILHSLGDDITLIDLLEGGQQGKTGCYVIQAEKVTIVETGTSHGAPYILAGLKKLKIDPKDVRYIIVTHIHLDHSGGLGSILPTFPNAEAVVHPRGARHLMNPSKLLKGAQSVYGDDFLQLFGEVLPVPEDRILVKNDNEILDIGRGRVLTFLDTPGHARHHFSIYDSGSKGVFAGDTVGVRYVQQFTGFDFEMIFPIASPPEFDKEALLASIEQLEKLNPNKIFHGHFGVTEPAAYAFERIKKTVEEFEHIAKSCFSPGTKPDTIKEKLKEYMKESIKREGYDEDDLSCLDLDLSLNSQGLFISLDKKVKS